MKHFKYAAAILVLLLSAASVTIGGYIHPAYKSKQEVGIYKNQSQSRIFLIAVIDSDDKDIGKRCETDLDEVTYAFEELADWLGIEMEEPKIIKGDQFSKAEVKDAIDWLQTQALASTDIVMFYYSGHGFRFPSDAGDYPRMWLKTQEDQNVETTNLRMKEDVYDRIIKMGAGVNIVLSDCCNTTAAGDNADFDNVMVTARKRVVHKRQQTAGENSDDDDMDNGDKLFIRDRPLSILATAAGKGELAGGKDDFGGFFTGYFLEALSKCIYDGNIKPEWENILNYADEKAGYWARSAACPKAKHNEQGRCIQTAKFNIK